jgi:sugar lactone lactonase YvrE
LTLSWVDTGLVLPNGMAFSPDAKTLYLTEMWARRIIAYDFEPRVGTVSRRRPLVTVPASEGYPDGLVVDEEGFLSSGHWQEGPDPGTARRVPGGRGPLSGSARREGTRGVPVRRLTVLGPRLPRLNPRD